MRKLLRFSFLITLVLSLFSSSAWSQVFSGSYNFANITNSSGTTDPTPVPTATGLTFSSFTAVGQTTLNPNASGRFSFTGQPLGATTGIDVFTGSINTGQYYQVTVTPVPGYSLDINSITFTLQRSLTGIRQYAVRSSLDYNTNLSANISPTNTNLSVVPTNVFQVSDASSAGENGSTITLGSSYDAITSAVTFRFYGWNAEASGGTFSIDNVTINGVANIITTLPSVNLSVSSNAGSEAGATVITVTATASEAVTGNQTVDLGVTGVNITSGDYTLSGSSITILSGETSGSATFTIVDDNLAEAVETAVLTISNPSAGIALGSMTTQNITITDNDAAPSVSVAAGLAAAEPATNGTFLVNLSSPAPTGGVTVTYTLGGTATLNTDYTDALAGTIVIPAGNNSGTITLSVTDDAFIEGTETISVTLNSATNSFVIGAPNSAIINLNDNDNPPIVVNEVYGGGGNGGANFKNDFIELFNNSNNPVNLAGWSVQYNSATSTGTWQVTNLTGIIPAHGYYLVQEAKGTGGIANLPTPDVEGNIAMAAGAGKVALVNTTTALLGQNPSNISIVDKVAYGSVTGGGFEGTGSAPAPSAVNAIQRTPIGFDANNNSTDFTLTLPTPKNSVTDITSPLVSAFLPSNSATNVATAFTASITFNENVEKGTGTVTFRKTSDGSILKTFNVTDAEVTVAGSSVSFLIQGLAFITSYYFEVSSGAFKDLSGNDFAGFNGNGNWSFTTENMPLGILGNLYDFSTCTNGLSGGFSFYSTVGAQVWDCSVFGRDPANPAGTAAFPNAVQMNGFAGGTNVPNVDWLISPSLDLTGTTYPLLSFWSRTAFNGLPLQLKVSTDYVSGDPSSATWTDVNGKFPAQTSNVWSLSENINLSAFKQSNVHFAFVYTSTDDDGARWTLDDIAVVNSLTPPPPSLTISTNDMQFSYVASGSTTDKTFTFVGNDLTGDVTLTATGNFKLSKDGNNFASSIQYTVAEANNVSETVYVRFAPAQNNQDFTGAVNISTSSLSSILNLKGTSIDPATTLEVVNWNLEWFGSTTLGPTNDNQQQQNVEKVLKSVAADVYGVVEVVDEARLASVVSNMPGYSYVIGNFGSHVNPPESTGGPLAEAQKLAFIYKTSLLSNISVRPLINEPPGSTSYNNWSSGRYPFLMSADVTMNCVTKHINFILIHAKANTSPTATSYARRQAAATELHDTIMKYFAEENVIILGDFNDDLDQSITAGFTTTSYSAFTTDNANFFSPTLALSLAGKKSTVSYNDMIDHVMLSNEMQAYYMNGTASALSDVTSLVTNYGSTTTDHYPVFTRYRFSNTTAPVVTTCTAEVSFCAVTSNNYTIPSFTATDDCADVLSYAYTITGATERTGTTNDASGMFNIGTSVIAWTATDSWGNSTNCSTTVIIKPNPTVTIPDAYALPAGTLANTVYIGYAPASSVTLTANASGGTPAYTYSWTNGSSVPATTVSPVTATLYTVTVTDTKGCTATADKTIAVIDVRGGKKMDKVNICHKTGVGTNNITISQTDVPDHLAHGDMLGTCSVTTAAAVNARISEAAIGKLSVQVFPNPSPVEFTLLISGMNRTEKISVRVLDLQGRIVEQRTNINPTEKLIIGDGFRSGVYFAEITQGTERKIIKLLKL